MVLIRYEYDNETLKGDYDELTAFGARGKKVWNKEALVKYAEPQRPVHIVCCCRNDNQEVNMHIVEKPIGSHRYYLATNPKSSGKHSPDCPKHVLDDPFKKAKAVYTKSAVQFRLNSAGESVVDVSINPFAGGIREQNGEPIDTVSSDVEQTKPGRKIYEESDEMSASHSRRAKAEFGGLIREWYLIGREFALSNRKNGQTHINRRDIIHGMWREMLNDRVLANEQSIKNISFVPHKSITQHRDGDRKILVGLFEGVGTTAFGEMQINIRGINTIWSVSAPPELAKKIDSKTVNRLISVRAQWRNEDWRLTHKPFVVLLTDPDAMWVESEIEMRAYAVLSKTRFEVQKPLRIMEDLGGLRPDFVLIGLDRPVIVEVYGRVGDPDYDEHKELKQGLYDIYESEQRIYYLEWDLSEKDGMAAFLERLRELESKLD